MSERAPFPGDSSSNEPMPEARPVLRGPFVRPDGILVTIYEPSFGGASVEFLQYGPQYRQAEIEYLGPGDFSVGLDRIAEGYCTVPAEYVIPGSLRLFQEELEGGEF
jgi:hypothetical protein